MTLQQVVEFLDRMADGDGYAIVQNAEEIEALRMAAEFIRSYLERNSLTR